MRGRVQPWMSDVITESQDKCFTPLPDHLGIKRIGAKLCDKMREDWFKQWSPWSILRDDVLVNLRYNSANDVFCCFVVILYAGQHLQVADDQCLLCVVRHFAVLQIRVGPNVDRAD